MSKRDRALGWLVHFFTATGVILALYAVAAIQRGDIKQALFLLGASIIVDAIDGFFARRARVKTVLPHFDGALLDNLVDYVTYAFVPALIFLESELLIDEHRMLAAVIVLIASAYQFCRTDAKTEDHFFLGFPSYWNILAFYFWAFQTAAHFSFVVICICGILSFSRIKFLYPSRMKSPLGSRILKTGFQLATVLWGFAAAGFFLLPENNHAFLKLLLLIYPILYVGFSLLTIYGGAKNETVAS